jgi:hypothetical protein
VEKGQPYKLTFRMNPIFDSDPGFPVTWVLQPKDSTSQTYFSEQFQIPKRVARHKPKLEIVKIEAPTTDPNATLEVWLGGPGSPRNVQPIELRDFSFVKTRR